MLASSFGLDFDDIDVEEEDAFSCEGKKIFSSYFTFCVDNVDGLSVMAVVV